MNKRILDSDVQLYLEEHLHEDAARIALQKSPFPDVSSAELARQADSKKRCEKKLPAWYATPGVYYPSRLAVEQSSSELTAIYKSSLAKGTRLIDLTGGLGVDAFFFSRKVQHVLHCEQNAELSAIAEYNARLMGADNIEFIREESIEYLNNSRLLFDTIYVDPSRRVQSRRVFLLKDTEPDVVRLMPLMLSKSRRIIIKTSPLFDLQSGLAELHSVSEIHVVSVKNDCKELLWVIDPEFNTEVTITCAVITPEETRLFTFYPSEEKSAKQPNFSTPLHYLYEPDVAILKAGAFKQAALKFGLQKLHQNTHLYTSTYLRPDFLGRIFKVLNVTDYKTFASTRKNLKANVVVRNFPSTPEELKKKHRLSDGGDVFLMFATAPGDRLIVIEAERLQH